MRCLSMWSDFCYRHLVRPASVLSLSLCLSLFLCLIAVSAEAQSVPDQVYSVVDDKGVVVFTDDASKVPDTKSGNAAKKERGPQNRTILENFNKKERSVISSLQKVLTAQCQGNLKAYREASLPQLRPLLDSAESRELIDDLRRNCVPYFSVTGVSFGKGIPELDLHSATAIVHFETYDALSAQEGAEKTEIEAFFAISGKAWKLINFPSKVAGGYSIKEELAPDAKQLLRQ